MAPSDEIQEEDETRFAEDEDSGPSSWRAETPAIFLDADWEHAGDVTSELAVPLELGGSFDFTVLAWVARAPDSPETRILSRGDASGGLHWAAGSKVRCAAGAEALKPPEEPEEGDDQEAKEPATESQVVSKSSIDDEQWHHLAVVFKEGQIQLYVDGQCDGEGRIEVPEEITGPVLFGEGETAPLRDVKVFHTALSQWQISSMMTDSKDLGTGITLALLPDQVTAYWALKVEGAEGARELLQQTVAADPFGRPFQEEVLLDLFEDLVDYANTICLTSRKTAVIVQILKQVLDMMHRKSSKSKRFSETTSIYECFREFKRLMVAHSYAAYATAKSSNKGDASMAKLGVFTLADVRLLTDFVSGALFQQFLLYQCVLICPQDQVTSYREVEVPQPLPAPDLNKAVSKKLAAKAKAVPKRSAYASRSKVPAEGDVGEVAEAESPKTLEQTLSQLPKDLSIDEHHEESTRAAEATFGSSIQRHDQELQAERSES
ncbi:unnamed protein product [Durusdinium trenchii]|uniref:LamG-like jellyroll fold domain-containing protein n=1 Tax=Durusdinium trenchii TaxID=1381693 RepID=A0ABP0Q7W7_9DINO